MYHIATKLPNGHEIYKLAALHMIQMAIKLIYRPFPIQGLPKFTQNWEFWFETIPSGNPADDDSVKLDEVFFTTKVALNHRTGVLDRAFTFFPR
jgi:hypothetical protein